MSFKLEKAIFNGKVTLSLQGPTKFSYLFVLGLSKV